MILTAEQRSFAEEAHIAVLATVTGHGEPHAAPMWYAVDGSSFLMVTRRGSQKYRNLERHPTATLVIDRRFRPYYALMVRCVAEITTESVAAVRSQVAARYLDEPELTAYLESRQETDSVAIRLEPVDVVVYGSPPSNS